MFFGIDRLENDVQNNKTLLQALSAHVFGFK